jgi:hypothetical protein
MDRKRTLNATKISISIKVLNLIYFRHGMKSESYFMYFLCRFFFSLASYIQKVEKMRKKGIDSRLDLMLFFLYTICVLSYN